MNLNAKEDDSEVDHGLEMEQNLPNDNGNDGFDDLEYMKGSLWVVRWSPLKRGKKDAWL